MLWLSKIWLKGGHAGMPGNTAPQWSTATLSRLVGLQLAHYGVVLSGSLSQKSSFFVEEYGRCPSSTRSSTGRGIQKSNSSNDSGPDLIGLFDFW